jgi:hypothetical protein
MRRVSRAVAGSGLAIGATVLLAALSRAPQSTGSPSGGVLRLSWSGHPERVEVCRAVSDEELQRLPRHMRQPMICDGRTADYRLGVTVDGVTLADDPMTGGGFRRERPIYLYREFPLAAGPHQVVVRFDLADTAAGTAARGSTSSRLDALPRALTLDTAITLQPRTVALVTYDPERRALAIQSR